MKRFNSIYIEITNVCNLDCIYCPKSTRPARFMSPGEFSRILDRVHLHARNIYLHVKGEPLMHPELAVILAHAHELGMRVIVTTNGTLLGRRGQLLIDSPAVKKVNISVHSVSELHGDEQGAYLESVFAFTRAALTRSPMTITLRLWNLESGGGRHSRNSEIVQAIVERFAPGTTLRLDRGKERVAVIREKLFITSDREFTWPGSVMGTGDRNGFCYGLLKQVAILVDGTVVPCCLDGDGIMALGNIHNNSLEEIIGSNRARAIHDGFIRRETVEGLCLSCTYKDRFTAGG